MGKNGIRTTLSTNTYPSSKIEESIRLQLGDVKGLEVEDGRVYGDVNRLELIMDRLNSTSKLDKDYIESKRKEFTDINGEENPYPYLDMSKGTLVDSLQDFNNLSFSDIMTNPLQSLGVGTSDLTHNGMNITSQRGLSYKLPLLDSIMRDIPYFNTASSWKATKALLNGVDLNFYEEKDATRSVDIKNALKGLYKGLHTTVKFGDSYGGSGALIMVKGHMSKEKLKTPLLISDIDKDSFLGIKPLSRLYQLQPATTLELVVDIGEEFGIYNADDFGQPLYFNVNMTGNMQGHISYIPVHRSRLLLFNSSELTYVDKQIEHYFGPSLLERAYSSFAKYESFKAQLAKLVQRSNVPILKLANIGKISLNSQTGVDKIVNILKHFNALMSIGKTAVIGEDESFSYESANLNGYNEILLSYKRELAADLRAPTYKVFNEPVDFDEEKSYNEDIRELQERVIRDWYSRLIPIIYKSKFNKRLKNYGFDFKSLEQTTEKEKAEKLVLVVNMLDVLYNSDTIDMESYHKMLRESYDNVGDIFNEITERYQKHIQDLAESNDFTTKSKRDIEVAIALNHENELGSNKKDKKKVNLAANKVESSMRGSNEGGDPRRKKKPNVEVPINQKRRKE